MKLYTHLSLANAKKIIFLANKKTSRYEINKKTGISKGKIKRVLDSCEIKKIKPNYHKPWKGPATQRRYSSKIYENLRNLKKVNKADIYAQEAMQVYLPFIYFCNNLYNEKILGIKVKRSANEYIKEFKKQFVLEAYPKKSWVYKMAKSEHYPFDPKWLPSSKKKVFNLKSDDERKKPEKYNSISKRANKISLRSKPGNFEIDGFIGKRNDKQALLTLIDINTGKFYSRFFDRTMKGFKNSLTELINQNKININTLTMDNGGENNLLHEIISRDKLFNCDPYCSGQKGTLENKHRIVRRIFKKSVSLDKRTNKDLIILNKFVNNYYSETFKQL